MKWGQNWDLLASIVATCKLNGVNPAAYIVETFEAIIDGHPLAGSKTSCHGDSAKRQVSLNRVPADFQLPKIFASIAAPSSISVRRDSPRQITVFPGGGSLARAKYPPSRAILTT